ncbi:hypothetical protein ACA910_003987 [Epithemia clementina (nom. ined.)]
MADCLPTAPQTRRTLGEDPIAKAVLFKDSKAAVKFAYTPCKCLSSHVQGAASSSAQVKLAPVEKDLGDKPSPTVAEMTTSGMWQLLVSNVETINKNVSQLREHTRKRFREAKESLDAIEYKVYIIKALLGDRPDTMGTSLVFDLLELLVSELHELQQGSQPSASAWLPVFPATVSKMVQEKQLSAVKAMLQHWIEELKTGNFLRPVYWISSKL